VHEADQGVEAGDGAAALPARGRHHMVPLLPVATTALDCIACCTDPCMSIQRGSMGAGPPRAALKRTIAEPSITNVHTRCYRFSDRLNITEETSLFLRLHRSVTSHDGSIGRGLRAVDQWIDSLRRVPVAKLPFFARPDRPGSAGILQFMPHFFYCTPIIR
jgi:hypothetical protein